MKLSEVLSLKNETARIIFSQNNLDLTTYSRSQRKCLLHAASKAIQTYVSKAKKFKNLKKVGYPDLSTNDCYDIYYKYLPRHFDRKDTDICVNKYIVPFSKLKTDPMVRKAMKHSNETILNIYNEAQKKTRQVSNFAVLKTLVRYGENRRSRPSDKLWDVALDITRKRFFGSAASFDLSAMQRNVETFDPSASAGNSFPGKKKGEVYKEAYTLARWLYHHIKIDPKKRKGIFRQYTRIAYRGHLALEGWDTQKTRPIFVTPFEVQLLESIVAANLYDHLLSRKGDGPMFFGEGTIRRLKDELSHTDINHTAFTADISHFDTDITGWMIYDALFKVIRPCLSGYMQYDDVHRKCIPQQNIDRLLLWIYNYNVHTPILLPNGKVVVKHGGLLSGSYLTQLLGSIINYATGTYCDLVAGENPTHFWVLGDDSRRKYDHPKHSFDLKLYSETYKEVFGFTVHPDKCVLVDGTNNDEDKFLGYQFRNCKLYRPTVKWFEMALFPEGDIESLSVSAARMLAFLSLGGVNDPLFMEFAKSYFVHYGIKKTGELNRQFISKMKYSTSLEFELGANLKQINWLNLFISMY